MLRIPMTVIVNGEEKEYVCIKIGTSLGYCEGTGNMNLINILEFTAQEMVCKEIQVDRMNTELFRDVGEDKYVVEIRAMQDYQPHKEEFTALLAYINANMVNINGIRIEKDEKVVLVYIFCREGQSSKQFVFENGEHGLIW